MAIAQVAPPLIPPLATGSTDVPYPSNASGDAVVIIELVVETDGTVSNAQVVEGAERHAEPGGDDARDVLRGDYDTARRNDAMQAEPLRPAHDPQRGSRSCFLKLSWVTMKGSAVRREYERERAMRGRAQTILPGLTAILGVLSTPSSVAAKPTCSSVAVEADPIVRGRWPELTTDLREALDGRSDLDACARVQVTSVEGSIAVDVALPDGRAASRHVKHREDVVPTIEALLLLPRASEPAIESVEAPASTAARPTPVVDIRQVAVPAIEAMASTPPPRTPPSRLRIELSITLSAHVGDGQKAAGAGAMSLLDIAGWLVGFDGRADRYDGNASAPAPMSALEIGVLGGRRLRSRDLAFDLVAGPALALRGGSGTAVAPVPSGSMMNTVMQSSARDAVVPRLRLEGRLTFRARSLVRTFLGVDGEVGDRGPLGPGPLGETHGLPAWTVGLAIGATVGTL